MTDDQIVRHVAVLSRAAAALSRTSSSFIFRLLPELTVTTKDVRGIQAVISMAVAEFTKKAGSNARQPAVHVAGACVLVTMSLAVAALQQLTVELSNLATPLSGEHHGS